MKFIHNDPIMKKRRRELRNKSTREEILLWNQLKANKLGKPFRRQFGIGPYIVDFYCHELKLIIELDGEYHNSEQQKDYDAERERFLHGNGYTILHFLNQTIHDNVQDVIKKIYKTMIMLAGAKSPSFRGGATRSGRGSIGRRWEYWRRST